MSRFIQSNQPVKLQDVNFIVDETHNGKLMMLPALAGARAITLPALAAGLHYRFMAAGNNAGAAVALGNAATISPAVAANVIQGTLQVNAAGVTNVVAKNNAPTVQLTGTALTGDYLDLYCDGTFWHVSGMSRVAAGLA